MTEHWTQGNWHGSRDTAEADASQLARVTGLEHYVYEDGGSEDAPPAWLVTTRPPDRMPPAWPGLVYTATPSPSQALEHNFGD